MSRRSEILWPVSQLGHSTKQGLKMPKLMWRFPEIGVPPLYPIYIPFISHLYPIYIGLSLINLPFWGSPILGTTPIFFRRPRPARRLIPSWMVNRLTARDLRAISGPWQDVDGLKPSLRNMDPTNIPKPTSKDWMNKLKHRSKQKYPAFNSSKVFWEL